MAPLDMKPNELEPYWMPFTPNRAFKKKDTGIAVDVQVGEKVYVARYLEGRSASGVQLLHRALSHCDIIR